MGFKSKFQFHSSIKAFMTSKYTSFFSSTINQPQAKKGFQVFWVKLAKQGRCCAPVKGRAHLCVAIYLCLLRCMPALFILDLLFALHACRREGAHSCGAARFLVFLSNWQKSLQTSQNHPQYFSSGSSHLKQASKL